MTYYLNRHVTQYDGSTFANANCCPASLANGADAVTGARIQRSGGEVRALVKRTEESNPVNPGWSLRDADLAMARLGVPFTDRTGKGWLALVNARAAGLYVVVAGDSEVFGSQTCSGAFDGDHCIGVHPLTSGTRWRIDDPICRAARWEQSSVIRQYASRFSAGIAFGTFDTHVPLTVWGPEIGRDIQTVDPLGLRVRSAVRETGHPGGAIVNLGDLTAALDRIGHGYGSVVNPADVRVLLDWAAKH